MFGLIQRQPQAARTHFAEVCVTKFQEVGKTSSIRATQCLRRMRGESQPHLMQAADGNLYVVKFQNNPQGVKILANEMLGASLAHLLGLPVAPVAVINVRQKDMIFLSQCMFIELARCRVPCQAGLCFGAKFRLDAKSLLPHEITPESVQNPEDFLGMLIFDKWTSNIDRRQITLLPNDDHSSYKAVMIDQGYCFGGNEWTLRDSSLQGVAHFPGIYERVTGIQDFEPWLAILEHQITFEMLRNAAETVPPEWYLYYEDSLTELIWQLNERRPRVRELVRETLQKRPDHFPNASLAKIASRARA